MAQIVFDSSYAPSGFLIVRDGHSKYDDPHTVNIDSDWQFPSVASRLGFKPCPCGGSDGTVACRTCDLDPCHMISAAYDFLRERNGQSFEQLDEYLTPAAEA